MTPIRRFLLVAVFLLAIACAGPPRAYDGPTRSRSQVARFVVFGVGSLQDRATETRFDGKIVSVDGGPVRTSRGYVDVLPGRRTLTVRWQRFGAVDPLGNAFGGDDVDLIRPVDGGLSTFEVDAQAGYRYELVWPRDDEPGGPLGFEGSRP